MTTDLPYSTTASDDIFTLLEEIQGIARTGMNFTENVYDKERYSHLLELASRRYAELLDLAEPAVRQRFAEELGQITPKVGADAAIFNERGEILLMKRSDDRKWCLPCGWVEPNEPPAETAVREAREETGLHVEVVTLVDVFSRKANIGFGPHSMIAVVYLCRITGGELTLSHEGLDLRYWPIDAVAAGDWHGIHRQYAQAAYPVWQAHLA